MKNNEDINVYFEIACGNNHNPSTDYVLKRIKFPSMDQVIDWSQPQISWKETMNYFSQPLREPYNDTSLKKYHCAHCVKSFNKARNRKRHVKLHHTPQNDRTMNLIT